MRYHVLLADIGLVAASLTAGALWILSDDKDKEDNNKSDPQKDKVKDPVSTTLHVSSLTRNVTTAHLREIFGEMCNHLGYTARRLSAHFTLVTLRFDPNRYS